MEEVRVKALELLRAMKGRPAALAYVSEFVEQSKKSGTVSRALRNGEAARRERRALVFTNFGGRCS
jgi:hypothetical protein